MCLQPYNNKTAFIHFFCFTIYFTIFLQQKQYQLICSFRRCYQRFEGQRTSLNIIDTYYISIIFHFIEDTLQCFKSCAISISCHTNTAYVPIVLIYLSMLFITDKTKNVWICFDFFLKYLVFNKSSFNNSKFCLMFTLYN